MEIYREVDRAYMMSTSYCQNINTFVSVTKPEITLMDELLL